MQTSAVLPDLTDAGPRATPNQGQPTSSATASFHGGHISAGLGAILSDGSLMYRGVALPFDVQGLKAFGKSARSIQGAADIYHLGSAEAFPGLYVAAGVEGNGGGPAVLRNVQGVEIRLHTREQGFRLIVAAEGLDVSWKPS